MRIYKVDSWQSTNQIRIKNISVCHCEANRQIAQSNPKNPKTQIFKLNLNRKSLESAKNFFQKKAIFEAKSQIL